MTRAASLISAGTSSFGDISSVSPTENKENSRKMEMGFNPDI